MVDTVEANYFTSSLVSLATAYSFYQIFTIQFKIGQKKSLIKDVKNAQIKNPSDLTTKDEGKKTLILGKVQRNKQDPLNREIIRNTENRKNQEFVLHFHLKEPIYSNDDFENKADYVINTKKIFASGRVSFHPNFLLTNNAGNYGGQSVLVTKYDLNHSYLRVLDITRWDNQKRRAKLFEKFQILMYSYWRTIGALAFTDKRSTLIRGLHIGEREVQCGIKVGSSILALGTVGITTEGKFFIEPQVLFRDRLSFVGYLEDIIEGLEESRNFWCLIGILGAVYLGRRAFHYNKKHGTIQKFKKTLQKFGLINKK